MWSKGSATMVTLPWRSFSQSHPRRARVLLAARRAARASPSVDEVVILSSLIRSWRLLAWDRVSVSVMGFAPCLLRRSRRGEVAAELLLFGFGPMHRGSGKAVGCAFAGEGLGGVG